MLKIAYIVYSRTGKSRQLASLLHAHTGGDIFEITEKRPVGENALFLWGALGASLSREQKIEPVEIAGDYDVLILLMPVWAGGIPPAVRAFLHAHVLGDKYVLCILTHSGKPGDAKDKMFKLLMASGVPFPVMMDVDSRGGFDDFVAGNALYALMDALHGEQ